MSAVGQNLFEALRDGLAGFRAKVEGEPGRRVVALGDAEGTIPELIRQVLGSVADALTWLAGALSEVERTLKVTDATLALLEVAGDVLDALTEGFTFGELPAGLGLEPGPFQTVEQAVAKGRSALVSGRHAMSLVPAPEHVAQVRTELEKLLGRRVNPALPDEGALGRLLAQVKRTNTP